MYMVIFNAHKVVIHCTFNDQQALETKKKKEIWNEWEEGKDRWKNCS